MPPQTETVAERRPKVISKGEGEEHASSSTAGGPARTNGTRGIVSRATLPLHNPRPGPGGESEETGGGDPSGKPFQSLTRYSSGSADVY